MVAKTNRRMILGIVDDKRTQRTSFKRKIERNLKNTPWSVIDRKPFFDLNDYPQWILENEISALILDERLNEEAVDGKNVGYYGHEVAEFIRASIPDMPLYSITNYERTADLRNSISSFNLVLGRSKFDGDIENYLNTITKSGEDYFRKNSQKLSRLGEIAELIASGSISNELMEEMKALQTYLSIPHLSSLVNHRTIFLNDLESTLETMKKVQVDIERRIRKE